MNGIIIIDKPANWTSHDVVAKLRGVLKQKRVGHGGTLDPMATGVLPVFIGRATRASEFCENSEKEYIAGFLPGTVTDTQDITGNVLEKNDVTINQYDLETVLPLFTGKQTQIPPMYSAVKIGGKKMYELARKGIEIERKPREIYISKLKTHPTDKPGIFALRIVCSKGTYIRTLCHDIGAKLGCGGTLFSLHRIRAGGYTDNMAVSLDDVIAASLSASVNDILLKTDSIFSEYPSLTIDVNETRKAKNGAVCTAQGNNQNGKYKIYSTSGEFLLFGEVTENKIKTIKSFFEV